ILTPNRSPLIEFQLPKAFEMNRSKSRSQSKQVLPENEIRCTQGGRCDNSLVAANADEIANIGAVIPVWSDGDAFLSPVQSPVAQLHGWYYRFRRESGERRSLLLASPVCRPSRAADTPKT